MRIREWLQPAAVIGILGLIVMILAWWFPVDPGDSETDVLVPTPREEASADAEKDVESEPDPVQDTVTENTADSKTIPKFALSELYPFCVDYDLCGLITKQGEIALKPEYLDVGLPQIGGVYVLDESGGRLYHPDRGFYPDFPFEHMGEGNGYIFAFAATKNKNSAIVSQNVGMMTYAGEVVVEPKYDFIKLVENSGYDHIDNDDIFVGTSDRKYGIIDNIGAETTGLIFDVIHSVSRWGFIAKKEGKWAVFEHSGTGYFEDEITEGVRQQAGFEGSFLGSEYVVPLSSTEFGRVWMSDARAPSMISGRIHADTVLKSLGGYRYLIKKEGKLFVHDPSEQGGSRRTLYEFDSPNENVRMSSFSFIEGRNYEHVVAGLSLVSDGSRSWYLDTNGDLLNIDGNPYFDYGGRFNEETGKAIINRNGQDAVINWKGEVLEPFKFNDLRFAGEVLIVKKNGKYGLKVEGHERMRLPCVFDSLYYASDGVFIAEFAYDSDEGRKNWVKYPISQYGAGIGFDVESVIGDSQCP